MRIVGANDDGAREGVYVYTERYASTSSNRDTTPLCLYSLDPSRNQHTRACRSFPESRAIHHSILRCS